MRNPGRVGGKPAHWEVLSNSLDLLQEGRGKGKELALLARLPFWVDDLSLLEAGET